MFLPSKDLVILEVWGVDFGKVGVSMRYLHLIQNLQGFLI